MYNQTVIWVVPMEKLESYSNKSVFWPLWQQKKANVSYLGYAEFKGFEEQPLYSGNYNMIC